jgi:hypothetical protein
MVGDTAHRCRMHCPTDSLRSRASVNAIGGALLSEVVGGRAILIASGFVLVIVGLRVLRPIGETSRRAGTERRQNRPLLAAVAAGIGLFTGRPMAGASCSSPYLLVFGLTMRQAVGTSLLVIAVLSIARLATHWARRSDPVDLIAPSRPGEDPARRRGAVPRPRVVGRNRFEERAVVFAHVDRGAVSIAI